MNIDEKIKLSFKLLGEHIQKLRNDKNISLKELSTKTGIRTEYLKKIENGVAFGLLIEKHLVKIAKAFDIKLFELFNDE